MTRWIGALVVGMLLPVSAAAQAGDAGQAVPEPASPPAPARAPSPPLPDAPRAPRPAVPPASRPTAVRPAETPFELWTGRLPVAQVAPDAAGRLGRTLASTLEFTGGTAYGSGLTALQQRQYERAITQFDRVVAADDERSDGARYWKAFAEHRLGRGADALVTLGTLRTSHPQSRYLPDAKILEAEIRRTSGQPLSLEDLSASDELKLLALNGLARTEPARAIPMIGDVLTAANSLAVKRRAIYVLALTEDEQAHRMLVTYASGGNPDLQSEAIRYLATRRDGRTTQADLRRIYESSADRVVRRAIIDAYRAAGDAEALVTMARIETNLELKKEIVARLSEMAPRSPAAADYLVEVLNR
jgi:hypothetical protein